MGPEPKQGCPDTPVQVDGYYRNDWPDAQEYAAGLRLG